MAAGNTIRVGAKTALKSYIKSRFKNKAAMNASPITTQHDLSYRYRRKAMPRYRRRRWKRFTRQVKHVMLQMNSLTSYSQDFSKRVTWSANDQATFGVMLGGTTPTNNDELYQIFRQAYGLSVTPTNVDSYKLYVKSMCLDVQITNTGSNGAILDVYELVCRKNWIRSVEGVTTDETLEQSYATTYAEMDAVATGVTPDANSPASTPFQNGLFLKYWRIMRKKEILLGAGSVTTMQMRNPANKTLLGTVIETHRQAIPGFTRAYLFQVRGTPRNNSGTAELGAGEVAFATQHSVVWAIPPGSTITAAGDI